MKAAQILAESFKTVYDIEDANKEVFVGLPDFGEITAKSIEVFFKQNQNMNTLKRLELAGVNLISKGKADLIDDRFTGKTFVLTGTLSKYTRDVASNIIKSYGGNISGSVSSKTDFVLAGEDAGSKLEKAQNLGVTTINEEEFDELIK